MRGRGRPPTGADDLGPGVAVRDAHQRHDRAAQADRPHLRHARAACSSGAKHYEKRRRHRRAPPLGRRDRQLAARPRRRPVPGPAVRERRPRRSACSSASRSTSWADAVRRHRPQTVSLVPAALRMVLDADLDPDDLSSLRSVISGTAPLVARRRRRVLRPGTACPCSSPTPPPSSAAAWPGWNLADHEALLGDQAGQRRPRPRRAASCASSTPRPASPLGVDAGGPARGARPRQIGDGASGSAPPTSPASTPTASSGSSAGPTRRSSAAASRCCPTTCAPRSSGTRACAAPRWWAATTTASVRCPSRPSSCATAPAPVTADDLLAAAAKVLAALRAARRAADRRRAAADRLRQGRPRRCPRPVRPWSPEWTCATAPTTRPSAPRCAPGSRSRCPRTGRRPLRATGRPDAPTTPPGSASSTTRATPALNWPEEFGGRGLPVTQQLVYLEEYARGRRALHQRQLRRADARRPDPHRRGHRRAAGATTCPGSSRARPSGARASPSPRPAPTWPRCAPGRCATATTTSSTARRSGAPAPTSPTTASCSCAPTPTPRSTRASPG